MIFSSKQEICFPLPWLILVPTSTCALMAAPKPFPSLKGLTWLFCPFSSGLGNSKSPQNFYIGWTARCASRPDSAFDSYSCWIFLVFFFQPKSYKSIISLSCYYVLSSTLISETVMAKEIYFTILFIPLLLHNYSPGSTSGSHPRSFYV